MDQTLFPLCIGYGQSLLAHLIPFDNLTWTTSIVNLLNIKLYSCQKVYTIWVVTLSSPENQFGWAADTEARLARPFFPIDREAALSHCWLLHLVVSRCMYLLGAEKSRHWTTVVVRVTLACWVMWVSQLSLVVASQTPPAPVPSLVTEVQGWFLAAADMWQPTLLSSQPNYNLTHFFRQDTQIQDGYRRTESHVLALLWCDGSHICHGLQW